MNAADLPDGSIVAGADFAYIKRHAAVGWRNISGVIVTNKAVQELLDHDAVTVLRVGTETDDGDWQWGVRAEYADGSAASYDLPCEGEAREEIDRLHDRHAAATVELIRRWRVGSEWQAVDEPGAEAVDA